ncbi:hypothetical protein MMC31_004211 [Peltigera leucophlebia]|nr:hypothetical protein [Peltigera leucophlebia]
MSDDEVDEELIALLRQSLGLHTNVFPRPAETKVLQDAEYISNNSIDVALDYRGCKAAASKIWTLMQERKYSFSTWSEHDLHPKSKDASTVDFIFTMDLLNFCFWSDKPNSDQTFAIGFRGKSWTGYWSLVAALQRALEEAYWTDETEWTLELLRHVFRSEGSDEIPLLEERISCLREAGRILQDRFDGTFVNCIEEANGSAAALVNLVVENFPCFRDEACFDGKKVRFYKRAQILVADLWACFEGESYGNFHDIDTITMFAGIVIYEAQHESSDMSQIIGFPKCFIP